MAKELKPEELTAAHALDHWLTAIGLTVEWSAAADEPPDLEFVIHYPDSTEQKWAVEVTGLSQYVEFQGKERNLRYITNSLQLICKQLTNAIPEGTALEYAIFVSAPMRTDWSTLKHRALEYIRSGETDQTALDFEEASGLNDNDLEAAVMRQALLPDSRASISGKIGSGGVSFSGMLEGTALVPDRNSDSAEPERRMVADIMASIESSVDRILQEKLPCMKRVEEKKKYDRKMILIWSDYFFAEADRIREVLSSKPVSRLGVDSILFSASSSAIEVVADPSGVFRSS